MISKKILVIKMRALGDTVIMTAALDRLREQYPSATIHVVANQMWASILEHHPAVNKIFPYVRHEEKAARAKAIARMVVKLRKEKYDTVINFHASPSSSLLALGCGASKRAVHFHGHKDKNRYSNVEIPGKGTVKPAIERDMDTLRGLGHSIPEGTLPHIYLTDDEIRSSEKLIQEKKIKGPILGMGLGASRQTKVWPMSQFAEISRKWVKEKDGSVAIFITPVERPFTVDLAGDLDDDVWNRIHIFDSLHIRQLAALLSHCSAFVGNDSGPKHVAVGVNCPTTTVIGPEHPLEWHPYPTDQHPYHFIEGLSCRQDAQPGHPEWCGLDICQIESHRCMKMISAETVYQTIEKVALK